MIPNPNIAKRLADLCDRQPITPDVVESIAYDDTLLLCTQMIERLMSLWKFMGQETVPTQKEFCESIVKGVERAAVDLRSVHSRVSLQLGGTK